VYDAADNTDITKLANPKATAITYSANCIIFLCATHVPPYPSLKRSSDRSKPFVAAVPPIAAEKLRELSQDVQNQTLLVDKKPVEDSGICFEDDGADLSIYTEANPIETLYKWEFLRS